jgi:type IV pilus assembly protein PilQ
MSPKMRHNPTTHVRLKETRDGTARGRWRWPMLAAPALLLALVSGDLAAKPLNMISRLAVSEEGAATIIRVQAAAPPVFSVFKLEHPLRLHVDVSNSAVGQLERLLDVQSWAVSQVAIRQFKSSATLITRVMINFNRPAQYRVRVEATMLVVEITADEPRPATEKPAKFPVQTAPSSAQQQTDQAPQETQQIQQEAKQVQAELESARALRVELKREADESQRSLKGRLVAIKAARSQAERERQQALADRLAAENEQKQAAADLALLKQKKKEAELTRLSAELRRKEVQSARMLAEGQTSHPAKQGDGAAKGATGASLARITDIRFVDLPDRAEVEISYEGRLTHQLQGAENEPQLQLKGIILPRLLQRALDTSAYGGPVKRITTFTAPRDQTTALVQVALRDSNTRPALQQKTQKLVWAFPKTAVTRKTSLTADKGALAHDVTYSYNSTPVAAAKTHGEKGRRYSGRRIDLDFKDADVHNILRLLSDVGNVNIITSDDVQGKVTIRMKNVPWDQALDVILRAKGLGQVREGNLIRVAQLTDLEKEREAEIARLKQISQLKPLETRLIPLSYARADKILDKLQYTLSPRGKLTFDDRTNMVIARDVVSNLDLMERLIRNLDSQTPQVLIEARIVEARSNYSKEIGVQWGGAFVSSQATGNSTGLVFPNQIGIGGGATDTLAPVGGILLGQAANPNFAVNLPASAGTGTGGALGLTLGSVSGNVNISLRLSAAEGMGDIRIVSAPKITTLDNVEAKIEQGVTIPFSQVSAAGVQTTFRDAKLNLTVRPHVTADGSVIMAVEVTRNEPDFVNTGPRGEPTILKKEAKTEMLVKDGDTAVIGGIYTTRAGWSMQKVPWFADIPILGYFFRTRKDSSDREEVLVFITPRIINRAQSIGR